MRGFLRHVGTYNGAGTVMLREGELVGLVSMGPTTAGVGNGWLYEDDGALVEIVHLFSNVTCNQVIPGPFKHTNPTPLHANRRSFYYLVTGTGNSIDVYAWSDVEGRRFQF